MEKEIYLLISNSKSKWDCIRNEHCRSINDNHCRTGCNFISMTIIRFWIIEDIREKNESDWDWLLNKNSLRMRIAKKEQETNLFEYVENHSINHFQTMNLVWFFFIVLDWFFRCIALSVSLNYFILYCLLLVFFSNEKYHTHNDGGEMKCDHCNDWFEIDNDKIHLDTFHLKLIKLFVQEKGC